jgi:LPS sulfotransferase NodH
VTPFVIVGMPRTGSTLLQTGIAQHPHVRLYGELFHKVRAERMAGHAILRDGRTIYYDEDQDDPIAFLERHVFFSPCGAEAVGLKIFAEYVWRPNTYDLFQRLKDHYTNLHVVHIVRRNYLDVLASRTIANLTQEWMRTARTDPAPTPRIEINREDAERFFKSMLVADRFFTEFFRSGEYLRIDYAELASEYALTLKQAFEFLGLSPIEPSIRVRKQINEPLSEIVSNYHELRSFFLGGEFGSFFEPN